MIEWLQALWVLAAGSEFIFPKRWRDPQERAPHSHIRWRGSIDSRPERAAKRAALRPAARCAELQVMAVEPLTNRVLQLNWRFDLSQVVAGEPAAVQLTSVARVGDGLAHILPGQVQHAQLLVHLRDGFDTAVDVCV